MTQAVTYERETKSVAFQGKIIVLESLTPVLPPKEKEQRKKEIERCLYEVFSKYGDRLDRKSTRLNSSHWNKSRMPSSA